MAKDLDSAAHESSESPAFERKEQQLGREMPMKGKRGAKKASGLKRAVGKR